MSMGRNRLEAFSDGVIAIIITIMVLELKVPHGDSLEALSSVLPVFLSYILSFIYVGIYWNNHHHLFHAVQKVNGKVLWANIHLLFWISLVPFSTSWMGENHFTKWPVVLYGFNLLMAAIAYFILAQTLVALHGKNSTLAEAMGKDRKGVTSLILYTLGLVGSFFNSWVGIGLFTLVAIIWFIPDRRIERRIIKDQAN